MKMTKNELLHFQVLRCPECNKEIAIILGMPEAIDLKEFKKRSQEQGRRFFRQYKPGNKRGKRKGE